jgi:hypothetical protein
MFLTLLAIKSFLFLLTLAAGIKSSLSLSVHKEDLKECLVHSRIYDFEYLYAGSKNKASLKTLLGMKNFENIRWSIEPIDSNGLLDLDKV